jgi:hypothetical protein
VSAEREVAVCIPAWQAEPFIERTLRCALAQTHANLKVLVSVDACTDATVDLCRGFASRESRMQVYAQAERLGWIGNTNFLLDQVESPYYFVYFHDDLIEPAYVEALLQALLGRPDAASAHSDTGHFGAHSRVLEGRHYEGDAARRIATMLVAQRGAPLRSLCRTDRFRQHRFAAGSVDGFWAHVPYLMGLAAAGPALHVPGALYSRWDKRPGGLTDGWRRLAVEQVLQGHHDNVEHGLACLRRARLSPANERCVAYCMALRFVEDLRRQELERGVERPAPLRQVHPQLATLIEPVELAPLGEEVSGAAETKRKAIAELEARIAQGRQERA